MFQSTRLNLNSSYDSLHKKSRFNFSGLLDTLEGIVKRERNYAGKLDKVPLIRISSPLPSPLASVISSIMLNVSPVFSFFFDK